MATNLPSSTKVKHASELSLAVGRIHTPLDSYDGLTLRIALRRRLFQKSENEWTWTVSMLETMWSYSILKRWAIIEEGRLTEFAKCQYRHRGKTTSKTT